MKKLIFAFALFASSMAAAAPACKVTVVFNDDSETSTTVNLQVTDATANPVQMLATVRDVSVAAWYQTESDTFAISITPDVVRGTFAQGLQPGPAGLTVIHDESPKYVATLNCNR